MNFPQTMLKRKLLMTCLTGMITLPLSVTPVAAITQNDISSVSGLNSTSFEPPPRKDAPRSGTAGGGSRNDSLFCGSQTRTKNLTALSPGKHIGLSHDGHPVLFVYLPKTNAQMAELSIFDANMNGIYQTNISVANSKGLIAIKLPSAPSLVKNQPYYWSFALACNPVDRTEDLVVGGWIEYRQLSQNLQNQLAKATSIERVSIYARNGYWYDAVATMIELQQKEPQNSHLARSWTELLTSVGLNLNVVATAY
ncbi:hypothetical protein NIES4071_04610 [Calothrix sp. NIES-4071]|nr:hypothetical protein NIES4071_04610 [Calothrix sp. NIES-4071]BAZ54807.1 hypothetical protein NIES4105_04600 [Calothrix sp. NIES-4105]